MRTQVAVANISRAPREGRLYLLDAHKHQVTIGHLQSGVFGPRVELEKNVDIDMRRHNGHLDAALLTTPD